MVMHARKQPRFDDGYMDKRDSHLYQSNKYPSKTYNDRYSKREDGRSRDDSPASRNSPRYIHKKPYSEKDKGRLERGAYSSPDKKVNHTATASSSRGGGSQNGSYDKSKANHRDHRQEVQKPALRTCGDWSEHVSSSGKQYYYNTRTGVSQWEKPEDWNDSKVCRTDRGSRGLYDKDSSGKNKYSSDRGSSGGDRLPKRQGSLEFNPSLHNEKPDKHYLIQKFQDSQRQAQLESRANKQTGKDRYYKESGTVIDHSGSNSTNRIRRDSDHRTPHRTDRRHGAQLDDMDISPDTSPSSRPSSCAGTPQMGPASTPISLPTPNMAAGHHPSSTPSSSTPFISSIPQLITQISGGQNNQELTNKALQTLQKLQEVISRQIAQQTTRASTSHAQHVSLSTSTSVATHTTLTRSSQHSTENAYNSVNSHSQIPQVSSPHVSANHVSHAPSPAYTSASGVYGKLGQSQQQHQSPYHQLHVDTSNGPYVIDSTAGQSPRSDHGQKSSCASPSSTTSSQDLPVGVGDISVAGLNQTNSPNVSSSLSQYYNEKLIGHVTGWQGDQAERQARRYWEEGISVGSFHCGQVGVELKRSRSLVRLAEIQSTLHEQRILFLSTQVHELESMKAPTFSSHSFSASQ
ncbi:WW domain-containing adapter protein with coiled-coil-like isoform X3 [Ostrea edulis]|uniref:WW domain-containing adapter protein with coiled-coil-like isoform X3 n=1 Tax=Ostrea edulis TaxID=37623 RepID=UPI0024AF350B|nr:WW domain-containing adapter protein with coiled-coil-like isoform X3 [Ostrea edulis]